MIEKLEAYDDINLLNDKILSDNNKHLNIEPLIDYYVKTSKFDHLNLIIEAGYFISDEQCSFIIRCTTSNMILSLINGCSNIFQKNSTLIIKSACCNKDTNVLKIILGADIINDFDINNILIYCCYRYDLPYNYDFISKINKSAVNILLEYGADPNINNGLPLKIAIKRHYIELAKTLLQYGADIDIVNSSLSNINLFDPDTYLIKSRFGYYSLVIS